MQAQLVGSQKCSEKQIDKYTQSKFVFALRLKNIEYFKYPCFRMIIIMKYLGKSIKKIKFNRKNQYGKLIF